MKNNIVSKYLLYLKENPERYWFKRKVFGWGWTPATWQGWVLTLVFIAFIIWSGLVFGKTPEPTNEQLMWFFVKIILAVALLIIICYKTGEKPKWQWGFPKKDDFDN